MLHFLRRIRKNLLSQNRFTKYLVYVVGEIILVVIGIMIALQVNNWNNKIAKDANTKAIFGQIIDELAIDVQVINSANNFYMFKDSLIQAYVEIDPKKIPLKSDSIIDYDDLIDMIRTFAPMQIHDRGFNLLMSQVNQMDKEFKPYIDELVFLYQDCKTILDLYNQRLLDLLKEHRTYKINNHDWYSRMHLPKNQKIIPEFEYFKYNATYKNYVRYYKQMIWNIFLNARTFEDIAIKVSQKINTDFNLNKDLTEKLNIQIPSQKLITSMKGNYLFGKDTITFTEKNNQLYESTLDSINLLITFEKYHKVGELRYLGDSIFYRNYRQNLKLNADKTMSIIQMNNRKEVKLTRINDD